MVTETPRKNRLLKRQENTMPNIASVLKEEISRLARKEIREQTSTLKKTSARYRTDIAEMKRQISDLQRKVTVLENQALKDIPSQVENTDAEAVRFTAKGLRSQRKRLGLSAANYGRLVGVTGQTIYSWEQEASHPRKQQVATLAAIRNMSKREAQARLEKMGRGQTKRRK
jgi:DNA-binding transcriptional regulator YiaG